MVEVMISCNCMRSFDPMYSTFHTRILAFEVHITSSLSPAWHTAALGEGDTITSPALALLYVVVTEARLLIKVTYL